MQVLNNFFFLIKLREKKKISHMNLITNYSTVAQTKIQQDKFRQGKGIYK